MEDPIDEFAAVIRRKIFCDLDQFIDRCFRRYFRKIFELQNADLDQYLIDQCDTRDIPMCEMLRNDLVEIVLMDIVIADELPGKLYPLFVEQRIGLDHFK